MHIYHFSSASLVLLGGLLTACTDDDSPTAPSKSGVTPIFTPEAALVGAPNTWEAVALMPSARQSAVAGAAVNASGRSIVFVFGGHDVSDINGINIFASVEAYDIAANHWSTKSGGSTFKLAGINGAAKIGGKFYLPGGGEETGNGFLKLRVLQVYDPAKNTWSRKRDMPGASATGVSGVIDGKLYVLTGEDNTYVNGQPCEDCGTVLTHRLFRYDPLQNQWIGRKSSPHYHVGGMTGVIGGKLYVTGGFGPAGTTLNLDVYNPSTDTWSSGAPLPSEHTSGVGVVRGGLFYVISGFTGEVVAYDPGTNRWIRKKAFPISTARFMAGATVLWNGKARIVVQVGLEDGFPNNGRATYMYTP